jgi:2'-phosphotransferase
VETEKLLKPILSADEIPGNSCDSDVICIYALVCCQGFCELVYVLAVCIHGTSMKNLDSILSTGLKKMARNHVHFATGLPKEDGVISGMLIYRKAKSEAHICITVT